MKNLFLITLIALLFSACSTQTTGGLFKVEGEVNGAAGKMLVFEASTLQGIVPLDSVKLSDSGAFSFSQPRPEAPEFYRLRIGQDAINIVVDSTETIQVKATADRFATAYQVNGSEDSEKIRELTLRQIEMQNKVNTLYEDLQAERIPAGIYQDSLANVVNQYKEELKNNYIFAAPNTPYAYFALFQRVGQYTLFDPLNNRDDMRAYAAVATSLYAAYPEAERSQNLYNIVIKGMKNDRQNPQNQEFSISSDDVTESSLIDISLKDMRGNVHKLSDLKGKVVLLDFTVYQSDFSADHNYQLRDLYDKYHDRGLEIFQISLDANEHYWKITADNLPWICVRDENGIYSTNVTTYNVQSVPTVYLLNRDNELYANTSATLEEAVRKLL